MMKTEKTGQKSKKKIMITFVLLVVGGGVLGFCLSLLMGMLQDGNYVNLKPLWNALAVATPFLFGGLHLICCVIALALVHSAKKESRRWDGEDETEVDTAERKLEWAIGLANVMMVVNAFLFAAMIQVTEHTVFGERYGIILPLIALGIFVLGYVWIIAVTNMSVKLEQKLNPEKRGNIFDLRFKKDWLESCDELEKQKIHECGYRAFQTGNTVCTILWVVAVFCQLWAGAGLLPQVMIFVIWLSMTLRYQLAAMKV